MKHEIITKEWDLSKKKSFILNWKMDKTNKEIIKKFNLKNKEELIKAFEELQDYL